MTERSVEVTFKCDDVDWDIVSRLMTSAIAEAYRYVMVPNTFMVEKLSDEVFRWSWKAEKLTGPAAP